MKRSSHEQGIRAMTIHDAPEAARIHVQELAGFISQLKQAFLFRFYSQTLQIPEIFTFVCIENSTVVGFLSGTERVKGMLSLVIFKDPVWFVLFFLKYFITHPLQIVTAIQTLMYPGFSGNEPELLTLAVDERHRGKGIGKKLFLACAKEFAKRGYSSFLISAYDRLPANGFYKRMGCTLIRTFSFHGERMNYYRYRISGSS